MGSPINIHTTIHHTRLVSSKEIDSFFSGFGRPVSHVLELEPELRRLIGTNFGPPHRTCLQSVDLDQSFVSLRRWGWVCG